MTTLWIVHRDPRIRAALARVAGAPEDAPIGAPGDPLFDSVAPAQVVVLGLAGDLEIELEFAHRSSTRMPDARWILVPERGDAAATRKLFDSIDATILSYPPDTRALRSQIHSLPAGQGWGGSPLLPLSQRPARDAVAQRFSRWFADLELPEMLRALDPQLGDVPLLILGEYGTGRGLIARYVHLFGPAPSGPFIHVACNATQSAQSLQAALGDAARSVEGGGRCTIWLEGVDTLSPAIQQQLARWIEFSPPPGLLRGRIARWIASGGADSITATESGLDPVLRDVLCGIALRLPSTRERNHLIAPFANDTALAWCHARRGSARRFGESALAALQEYPWPGNLRELEAVVIQTLAAGAADPIQADDLQYDGTAFAPVDASAIGMMLDADPAEKASPLEEKPLRSVAPEPDNSIQHLVSAIAHELRNPLSTIRTFAELLPERYDDAEFRSQFAELVTHDTRRIEGVVQRLMDLTTFSQPESTTINIANLLEELLLERTERVRVCGLLVLKELDTQAPDAVGDAGQLRFALESLLDKSLELAPKGGNLYIASSHHPTGLRGGPAVRVLLRFGGRGGESPPRLHIPGTSTAENALEYAIAEAIIRAQGGNFSLDTSENNETVLLLDIPA